jgi:hypothetical protein
MNSIVGNSWLAVGLALVLLGRETAVQASSPQVAKDEATQGKDAFEQDNLKAALRHFQYAYLLGADTPVVYNVAAVYEKLSLFHDSILAYERFVQLVASSDDAKMRYFRSQIADTAVALRRRREVGSIEAPLLEARRANEAGKYAFEHRDYEVSFARFFFAYLLMPSSELLYNIGLTVEASGQYKMAARLFDRFLETAEPAGNDDDRQFRARLAARADADRDRPSKEVEPQAARLLSPLPPPVSTASQLLATQLRTEKLEQARTRRRRGIGEVVAGIVLFVPMVVLTSAGAQRLDKGSGQALTGIGVVTSFVSIPLLIVGPIEWTTGNRQISQLE